MNRTRVTVVALFVVAASVSATAVFIAKTNKTPPSSMIMDQQLTRDKFFGSTKKLLPIDKGQEMRPRW